MGKFWKYALRFRKDLNQKPLIIVSRVSARIYEVVLTDKKNFDINFDKLKIRVYATI